MPVSKVLAVALAACAMSLLSPRPPASAQGEPSAQPTSRKGKEKGTGAKAGANVAVNSNGGGTTRQRRLQLCLETWDAQTHMSKREWRVACARSVKNYPEAFN